MAMFIYFPEIWSASKAQVMALYYMLKDLK
ncbi:hypothetical protein AI3007V1_1605 [Klebsiella pneumoniae]|nr:hypothetical protein AI3007V1_1605 [Klebsiella pneumoniae]VTO30510.1 Uncharacterised protein [Klebsiella quasipneumoniae]CAD2030660.1 hypothetical protein AI2898V1_1596 [Klebsiella pneumoniae]CAF2642234.1 hypothetical protein AI2880V1_1595 [Klebsiella pneumoniae]CAH5178803.1 hypothetical protein AI2880V1_1595 [Klebsiella pneumoniae]